MKNTKRIQSFNEHSEESVYDFDNKKVNYNDALSDFMIDIAGELGGGLPGGYFTSEELKKLENIFKIKYDADIELNNILDSKIN